MTIEARNSHIYIHALFRWEFDDIICPHTHTHPRLERHTYPIFLDESTPLKWPSKNELTCALFWCSGVWWKANVLGEGRSGLTWVSGPVSHATLGKWRHEARDSFQTGFLFYLPRPSKYQISSNVCNFFPTRTLLPLSSLDGSRKHQDKVKWEIQGVDFRFCKGVRCWNHILVRGRWVGGWPQNDRKYMTSKCDSL